MKNHIKPIYDAMLKQQMKSYLRALSKARIPEIYCLERNIPPTTEGKIQAIKYLLEEDILSEDDIKKILEVSH